MRGRTFLKGFLTGVAISLGTLCLILGPPALYGGMLHSAAERGDADSQFQYAKWLETRSYRLQQWLPIDGEPDVEGGYHWLTKAAAHGHPEALYALGVRWKQGLFVPPYWHSSPPNVARGQKLIDEAILRGYQPAIDEDVYYWKEFRR
jgi:TPR repeat protein